MTELTCDNFLSQLFGIKSMCESVNITKLELELAINLLKTYETNFNNEILVTPLPSTYIHLDKYYMVRYENLTQNVLQSSIIKLMGLKTNTLFTRTVNNIGTSEERSTFENEIKLIKTYYKDEILSLPSIDEFRMRIKCSMNFC